MVYIAWRLPPKAAMPEHGAGVVEAKRNGGLDLLKTAVSVSDTGKRTKSSARQRFFFFSPLWRQIFEYVGMFHAAKAKTYHVSQSI